MVGEHAHALIKGLCRLVGIGRAVPQCRGDSQGAETLHQLLTTGLFRRQGDQGDVSFETTDALLQGLQARRGDVLGGVGSPACLGQKGAFQMRPQQAALSGLVPVAHLTLHR